MWYNTPTSWLLRSPFHGLISSRVGLITVPGRKSGKPYTLPVNYVRICDEVLIVSPRERSWWRNLRKVTPVTLELCGQAMQGQAQAVVDSFHSIAGHLERYLQKVPGAARALGVHLDSGGYPRSIDLIQTASRYIVVRIQLDGNQA
jgi:deazaflavin-dependent oxidoreductase (nitroreductase family)